MMRVLLFVAVNLAVVLVAGLVLNLLGVGHFLENKGTELNLQSLLIYCVVFGFIGSFISLLISKPMAKWTTKTQIIENPTTREEIWLVNEVRRLADAAGIGMPEVGIMPMDASNAFATGWNKNKALVAVSQGLLRRFNQDEIKAVLGHEIAHVANGDMVTLALIQGVVNTFVMFFARIIGFAVDRFLSRGSEENSGAGIGFYIATFIAEILLGILASMIVMWFSRRREYRADEGGAKLVNKQSMISALRRLQAEQGMEVEMPEAMRAFGIRPNTSGGMLKTLFMTHPPLEDRIAALQEFQG
jgi:heat shock protein HtpX